MKTVEPAKSLPRVWAVLFAVVLACAFLVLFLSKIALTPACKMSFVEEREPPVPGKPSLPPPPAPVEGFPSAGLTVLDAGKKVLSYVYGDTLPLGVDPRYTKSSYIHPLYSLDGQVLTEDFPRDHRHHHGLFWAWPVVEVRGIRTSNWELAEPSLRQLFVKWIEREVTAEGARLVVENTWKLGGTEDVAEETVTILVHGATLYGRAIDIEIILRPVGGPITLRGTPADNKGYGGLCFRGLAYGHANIFKGAAMTTDEGPLAEDSVGAAFRWADISTPASGGVAIFVSPDHPGYPLAWLVRNSYAGIINPCWPGLEEAVLAPGVPISLRYRIYVHRGDAVGGRVKEAYEAYIAGRAR
ncbi:MAG: hypothetical protein HGA94_02320 [Candidatus Aminicenantes bacterium]|nr:hypothetical protein [Candidatus Aminicenantes bacterium]